ncbi:hypothetical protein NL676_018228 [Syzygium grande]|nr:hypothetical protein NL676_018228 [Syzygium grande]
MSTCYSGYTTRAIIVRRYFFFYRFTIHLLHACAWRKVVALEFTSTFFFNNNSVLKLTDGVSCLMGHAFDYSCFGSKTLGVTTSPPSSSSQSPRLPSRESATLLQSSTMYGDFLLWGRQWQRQPSLIVVQFEHAVSAGGEGDRMDKMGCVVTIDDLTMTVTRMMLTILLSA